VFTSLSFPSFPYAFDIYWFAWYVDIIPVLISILFILLTLNLGLYVPIDRLIYS
jgi:hypothetical protein